MFDMPNRLIKIGRAPEVTLGSGPTTVSTNLASVLTRDMTVGGNVTGGDLQVDGLIKGDVRVTRLSVGEEGRIEGAIHAEAAEVRGRVVGSITAKQIRLHATAHIEGDLIHEQLTIEPGAFFDGSSQTTGRHPPPPPASPPMEES
jgi:cytoskeletal protein CcmA (bactofilin family)